MNKQLHTLRALRSFLMLWAGQAISQLGSSVTAYALILWIYQQEGTATSLAMSSFFMHLPSIALCFIAGTLADRWDKKKIMLISDALAALGTLTLFILYGMDTLSVWHLYLVNFILSCMAAFQNPASYVAVSLIAPKDQYARVAGFYEISRALVAIVAPALGAIFMQLGGLKLVFSFDLITFALGVSALIVTKIPRIEQAAEAARDTFWQSCLTGLKFFKNNRDLFSIVLFFAFINLLAYATGYGVLPAMILERTQNDQSALGFVSSARGIGALIGSLLVTLLPPARKRGRAALLCCGMAFLLENFPLAIGRVVSVWCIGAALGEFCLPYLNASLTSLMRERVPIELQGRVFATRDTLQYITIPIGLFAGGLLADHIFEPAAAGFPNWITALVGNTPGSGMALMALITGVIGTVTSFIMANRRIYK